MDIEDEELSYQVYQKNIISYYMILSDKDIEELLGYFNAKDFEPYRNRKMSMDDSGYWGYRDEYTMFFIGITSSYIPIIELPMDFIYSKKYEPPTEKLYNYLIEAFFRLTKMV